MGIAVHPKMAASACVYAGWRLGEARERDATRFRGQPHFGESVSALCVRRVDAAEVCCMSVRALCGRCHIHCDSEEQARQLQDMLQQRFAECKLELHSQKTKIVYCKDANRQGNYPEQNFDFLGHTFRPRGAMGRPGKMFVSFIYFRNFFKFASDTFFVEHFFPAP